MYSFRWINPTNFVQMHMSALFERVRSLKEVLPSLITACVESQGSNPTLLHKDNILM